MIKVWLDSGANADSRREEIILPDFEFGYSQEEWDELPVGEKDRLVYDYVQGCISWGYKELRYENVHLVKIYDEGCDICQETGEWDEGVAKDLGISVEKIPLDALYRACVGAPELPADYSANVVAPHVVDNCVEDGSISLPAYLVFRSPSWGFLGLVTEFDSEEEFREDLRRFAQ